MSLQIYNTLTRKKELFTPLDPQNVRMYVCGPTVYDFAHIGNARPAIVFDVLFRLLRHLYGAEHVKYVRNITDVDDKINARALRDFPGLPLNEAIRKVTETTANQYFADTRALGCLDPNEQPRATEHIQGMVDMISVLINKGHAYVAAGEVLFDVAAMADYGKLSGRKLDEQQAGARIAVEAHKKNAADFVLWKLSSADEPGWDSPWGRGRPGWHIECSVMSQKSLGEVFDIHGGGLDLIFPHHENEIAQSRCAHGTNVMARYWMHNGFLQVEGKKMSKSDGNFVTIADVLKDWGGEVARFNMLRTHYRQPIDWTRDSLETSENTLRAWQESVEGVEATQPDELFVKVLCDDLNTHGAFTRLHEINTQRDVSKFKASLLLLGFALDTEFKIEAGTEVDRTQIVRLVEDRLLARHNKDWKESDRIRDELAAMGIAIKDNKDGTTTWEVKR
jgi:cysteinyl-tRNA synthetase